MIFYFTGTGNSLFAAKRLLGEGERLVNIATALKKNETRFEVCDGENVGFVFPVYFYTVPEIIKEFISKLDIKGAGYVYSVITCGGSISQTGAVLKKLLEKRGLTLSYVTPLLMPDNGMLFYQIPSAEEGAQRLSEAEKRLSVIADDINNGKITEIGSSTVLSDLTGLGFKLSDKTSKFYADENCTGCRLCESVCPIGAIEIRNGKPEWIKARCTKCSACINRCPNKALQYGKATVNRNRYVNPEI